MAQKCAVRWNRGYLVSSFRWEIIDPSILNKFHRKKFLYIVAIKRRTLSLALSVIVASGELPVSAMQLIYIPADWNV
ncbi:hypothetical protein COR50_18850 [Chitinophaga caeni]|uniref:Uncharacterized protein n=1 Tax=Chitinophaga caeni TaxID=2029983 RepID=A0A291QYV3_9BACT|nr:hypothetical protein COR50_18850 [Chitinophaga caeni]